MNGWYIVAGVIALIMTYAAGRLRRMPLSTSIIYLAVGYVLGPNVLGLLLIDPRTHSTAIQWISEVVIVISIFSSALKLRAPIFDRRWLDPLRLGTLSMIVSIAGVLTVGSIALGLSVGAALLLGGILAPTDPVLASDVQVERPFKFNRLRFALTGEAAMNDGAAFPVVLLGLGLIGVPSQSTGWEWFLKDALWGIFGGAGIGAALGYFGAKYMLHLRLAYKEKLGTDNFLALGLMALSYGVANLAHALGFVAVFAAGVAARAIERQMTQEPPEYLQFRAGEPTFAQQSALAPETAAVFMLGRMSSFTENLEQIGEAVVAIMLGGMLRNWMFLGDTLIVAPLLFFIIRPASVFLSMTGSRMNWVERGMAACFGIRGMASIFYVVYIFGKGAPAPLVRHLEGVALGVVAYSILLHGIAVTPLMNWFDRHNESSA